VDTVRLTALGTAEDRHQDEEQGGSHIRESLHLDRATASPDERDGTGTAGRESDRKRTPRSSQPDFREADFFLRAQRDRRQREHQTRCFRSGPGLARTAEVDSELRLLDVRPEKNIGEERATSVEAQTPVLEMELLPFFR